jgi:hypothetical protein
MKTFGYFVFAFSTLGALLIFALLIDWGVSLPNTALLWANGPVIGWAFLLIFASVSAFFAWMPAILINEEIKINSVISELFAAGNKQNINN